MCVFNLHGGQGWGRGAACCPSLNSGTVVYSWHNLSLMGESLALLPRQCVYACILPCQICSTGEHLPAVCQHAVACCCVVRSPRHGALTMAQLWTHRGVSLTLTLCCFGPGGQRMCTAVACQQAMPNLLHTHICLGRNTHHGIKGLPSITYSNLALQDLVVLLHSVLSAALLLCFVHLGQA